MPFAVGLESSAIRDKARLRGLTHAVGLKPSASQDEARLRGLTHAVGLMEPVFALCRRAEALGYTGQSPPAQAVADYLLKDHEVRCAPAPPVQRCCAPRMRFVPWG